MAREPSEAWISSIDATYRLIEDADVRRSYPQLAAKVESAIRACESALDDYGYVDELTQPRAMCAQLQWRQGL